RLEPGSATARVTLAPYETAMFETAPAGDATSLTDVSASPRAEVAAATPIGFGVTRGAEAQASLHYALAGSLNLPNVSGTELRVLVESPAKEVAGTTAQIALGGRRVTATKSTSAGQWAAAGEPSPENWSWFIVPLTAGATDFSIDLDIPLAEARVGVFLRGAVPAVSEPAQGDGPAFPLFKPDQRGWSQTIAPLQAFAAEDPDMVLGTSRRITR